MTNNEWKELLSKEFNVSKNTANKMLHAIMKIKEENTYRIENKVQLDYKPKTT